MVGHASGNVMLFDPDGKLERLLGRSGQGPDEYRSPADPLRVAGDTLLVEDDANRRTSWVHGRWRCDSDGPPRSRSHSVVGLSRLLACRLAFFVVADWWHQRCGSMAQTSGTERQARAGRVPSILTRIDTLAWCQGREGDVRGGYGDGGSVIPLRQCESAAQHRSLAISTRPASVAYGVGAYALEVDQWAGPDDRRRRIIVDDRASQSPRRCATCRSPRRSSRFEGPQRERMVDADRIEASGARATVRRLAAACSARSWRVSGGLLWVMMAPAGTDPPGRRRPSWRWRDRGADRQSGRRWLPGVVRAGPGGGPADGCRWGGAVCGVPGDR